LLLFLLLAFLIQDPQQYGELGVTARHRFVILAAIAFRFHRFGAWIIKQYRNSTGKIGYKTVFITLCRTALQVFSGMMDGCTDSAYLLELLWRSSDVLHWRVWEGIKERRTEEKKREWEEKSERETLGELNKKREMYQL
jgi:hypothetical protein